MRQAITTKYLGPTNTRGARIKAEAEAGSVTISYPHELSVENAHLLAMSELAQQLGWYGTWVGGGIGKGFVFALKTSGSSFSVKKPRR